MNCRDVGEARQALYRLRDELMQLNPSAADTLQEGIEEILALHELEVHARLRRSLGSTNGIDPASPWSRLYATPSNAGKAANHRLSCVGYDLLYAETPWNRLHGYRHLPHLIRNLKQGLRCTLSGTHVAASPAA